MATACVFRASDENAIRTESRSPFIKNENDKQTEGGLRHREVRKLQKEKEKSKRHVKTKRNIKNGEDTKKITEKVWKTKRRREIKGNFFVP